MDAITGMVVLLAALAMSLLVIRIATVMLMFTGLSRELARFQARSAFTCCGFTTGESEQIVQHPVRRRIVLFLMLCGNGTVVLAISSLIPVILSAESSAFEGQLGPWIYRVFCLFVGITVLWAIAASPWIDANLSRIIAWALRRFTRLEVQDFHGLLRFSEGFSVQEMNVGEGHWLVAKNLIQLRLGDEGVQVLGSHRKNNDYVGTPSGTTYIRNGDRLVLYGRTAHLSELEHRPSGPEGDAAHEKHREEHQALILAQERSDLRRGASSGRDAKAQGAEQE